MFLSQEDVVAAGGLDVAATIDVVEEALRLHAVGDTRLPSKSALMWSDDLGSEERQGRIMAMPAYVGGSIALAGLKWIPSVPSNPARGLPRGIGLIVLTDPETGLPVAVMDGTIVSAARTGAVTGVSARRLARADARVAAIWDIDHERTEAFRTRSDRVVPVANGGGRLPRRGRDRRRDDGARAVRALRVTRTREPLLLGLLARPEISCVERVDLVMCDLWDHETGHASRPLARALAAGAIAREEVVELPDLVAGRHPAEPRTTSGSSQPRSVSRSRTWRPRRASTAGRWDWGSAPSCRSGTARSGLRCIERRSSVLIETIVARIGTTRWARRASSEENQPPIEMWPNIRSHGSMCREED